MLIAQITSDNKLKLKGTVTTGENTIAIDKDGNLFISEIHTQQPSFDDAETIDDTYLLDDAEQFDDTNDASTLFESLFDLIITSTNINYFSIDVLNKVFLLNGILENQDL